MIKKTYILLILLLSIISSVLFADDQVFCVIEKDTIQVHGPTGIDAAINDYLVNIGDQGYPHIKAVLNTYKKENGNEYFQYRIDKGQHAMIDTVVFGDYSPREISLLSRYITLPESGEFNYTDLRNMLDELRSNPLLKVQERADIYDSGLRLYTEAKQDIRFDAMAAYKQENDKQGVVGEMSLELVNLGGLGRLASFYWSRPTLGVNSFDLSYTEPYIFNKPFSAKASFSQRYQDSLYVKRDLDLAVIYHMNQRSSLIVNYVNEQISTSESGSDSGFVSQNRSGSNVSLTWRSKPGKVSAYFDLIAGLRFATEQRISTTELKAGLKFRPSVLGLNLDILGGYVGSEDPIALYDQFKLGGANFLRGAYFEQYATNAFIGWKIEAGYFKRLHLFAFYDGVVMDHSNPVSHHLGFGFSLPAGNNNRLTIALGMNPEESFRQAKFHVRWEMP
jgi:hypothetical protein